MWWSGSDQVRGPTLHRTGHAAPCHCPTPQASHVAAVEVRWPECSGTAWAHVPVPDEQWYPCVTTTDAAAGVKVIGTAAEAVASASAGASSICIEPQVSAGVFIHSVLGSSALIQKG